MLHKTVDYMIELATDIQTRNPIMYHQLIRSFQAMSQGEDGGQAEAWSMFTIRGENYPEWTDADFDLVLTALGEGPTA